MRIDPTVKEESESIFKSLGLSLSDAINVFLHKSIQVGGIPFDVRQPRYNAQTEAAMNEARDIMNGKVQAKGYSSVAEMVADLEEQGDEVSKR